MANPLLDSIRLTYIIALIVMLLFVGFIIFVVLMYNRKQMLYIKEKQLKESEHKNQLLEKELEKQKSLQNERSRISRDMHDEIGAGISAIKLQAEILKQQIINRNIIPQEIDDLISISENMNLSMREILWSLNSDNDDFDCFSDYCLNYLESYFSKTKIKFHFQKISDNEKKLISAEIRRNVLLIIKEAAHNIVKHSRATDCFFEFSEKSGKLSLTIKDSGIGFAPNSGYSGYGLASMKSRVENIGGEIDIKSGSAGTFIEIRTRTAE